MHNHQSMDCWMVGDTIVVSMSILLTILHLKMNRWFQMELGSMTCHPILKSIAFYPSPNLCLSMEYSTEYILKNRHIVDAYMSMWFEDIIENDSSTMEHLWTWLDVNKELKISPIKGMPLVMATCPPRERRWFEKINH